MTTAEYRGMKAKSFYRQAEYGAMKTTLFYHRKEEMSSNFPNFSNSQYEPAVRQTVQTRKSPVNHPWRVMTLPHSTATIVSEPTTRL
jgi:hypothetical protein